jgi:tRNA threonylcarbamoyladenosine biosynthesis protein TsaE
MGPLGAGKTTLVQGIAEGRGYKRGANSPTFALANEYGTKKGNVYHMDMYRLTEPELRAFPLEEYWQDGLCLIEWADRVRDRWPEDTLAIELRAPNPDTRTLTIQKPSPRWRTRLQALPAQ